MLTFDRRWHQYHWNGTRLLSQSKLMKQWQRVPFDAAVTAAKQATKARPAEMILAEWDYRRNIGTRVHAEIEAFLMHGTPPSDPELEPYTTPALRFIETNRIRAERIEYRICDPERGVAGTLDTLAFKGDSSGRWIIDWKTNRRLYRNGYNDAVLKEPLEHVPDANYWTYALQQAIYQEILERPHGTENGMQEPVTVRGRILVHLPGNGTYTVLRMPQLVTEANTMLDSVRS